MGDSTGIEWTDATWNPVRGCSRVSAGCMRCYAERVAARFSGPGQPYHGLARRAGDVYRLPNGDHRSQVEAGWTGVVRIVPEHLADPLKWKRPRRIFVNSMSDLFHEDLPDDSIDQVFAVMIIGSRHTYQVLTKRAGRMRAYITTPGRHEAWSRHIARLAPHAAFSGVTEDWWPTHAGHIWLGVSVENQDAADERIPELLRTPAAIRFLSCEPLLGPVDLRSHFAGHCPEHDFASGFCTDRAHPGVQHLGWVIAGCESGPGARPCDVAWLRTLRDQCADSGVPYFLKQAREWPHGPRPFEGGLPLAQPGTLYDDSITAGHGSKRKPGGVVGAPYLDGVQHLAFPGAAP